MSHNPNLHSLQLPPTVPRSGFMFCFFFSVRDIVTGCKLEIAQNTVGVRQDCTERFLWIILLFTHDSNCSARNGIARTFALRLEGGVWWYNPTDLQDEPK